MKNETFAAIAAMISEFPVMAAQDLPDEDEVESASRELGVDFPDDYRELVLRFGGIMIGPYPIFGLRPVATMGDQRWSIVNITKEVREIIPIVSDWCVFSEDHAGNPIGFDGSGRVWIYDHDFEKTEPIATDFESYLRVQCLHLPS